VTLGIIVPFPDGVLFVADGRQVNLYATGEPVVSDELEKIHQITPDVALISFGVSGVTGHFLETLRQNYPIPHVRIGATPEDIANNIDLLLERIWQHVTLPEGTDLTSPSVVAGFGFGGLASGVPFVGTAIRAQRGRIAFEVSADQRARAVIGGVGCDARQIYLENERRELNLHDQIPGNTEPTVYALIRGAAHTVREVRRHDPSVGGTIQYAFFTGAPNVLPMVRGTDLG
jgi:hypothetical protein